MTQHSHKETNETIAETKNYKVTSCSNIGRSTVNARKARSVRDEESSTEPEARLSLRHLRYRYRTEEERESSVECETRRSQDRDRHKAERARESLLQTIDMQE
ncbi:hypothetical protein HHI36_016464 [Cryptolaemus montrouzieri]|uniref:Uncharacterized protein n=1 Tax=Cryptolaemus montrouzieri TaxID=559131 RepID=A0ABD2NJS4_9CUCU